MQDLEKDLKILQERNIQVLASSSSSSKGIIFDGQRTPDRLRSSAVRINDAELERNTFASSGT
jgi:hypothetical protein